MSSSTASKGDCGEAAGSARAQRLESVGTSAGGAAVVPRRARESLSRRRASGLDAMMTGARSELTCSVSSAPVAFVAALASKTPRTGHVPLPGACLDCTLVSDGAISASRETSPSLPAARCTRCRADDVHFVWRRLPGRTGCCRRLGRGLGRRRTERWTWRCRGRVCGARLRWTRCGIILRRLRQPRRQRRVSAGAEAWHVGTRRRLQRWLLGPKRREVHDSRIGVRRWGL